MSGFRLEIVLLIVAIVAALPLLRGSKREQASEEAAAIDVALKEAPKPQG